MKARYCLGFILAGILTALNAGAATAAQPQPEATSVKPHATKPAAKPAVSAKQAAAQNKSSAASKPKSKSVRRSAKKPLPAAKLDLSLPPDMVRQLKPLGTVPMPAHKPLLPNMFGDKTAQDSPFQLNGRLISNEMGLQLRNEARQNEIEGAALEFEFKQ
ncbi:translation initiation factor 2 [Pseudomonas saxonica]|uniref:Translation initiation factor 2 n=1 Tax=Pseudomonas saxonica TaxID=2600598 RepID=A0A5C5PS31_9PSED|nr:translation initiation factor 2 [Pseudomonas saxonica]TWR82606.1 translation initiation factor 2 [Pseudomonas saxonica]WRQ73885.1 translation initiation factor 2 [Pseudomonas saxonica]